MPSMREMVSERIERIKDTHSRAKEGRYGFMVRPLTLTLGWTIVIIGLITIPLPGQGWLTTFIGVGILSLEQRWAKNLLVRGVHLYDRFFAWFHRQRQSVRVTLVILLIVVIWIVFIAIVYGMWRAGTIDFLTPWAAQLGLVR
ncbi:TIGR02611 family protein [Corynebacterium sp.]|uniref:TIGR02611 family protein n=1 Tax=Corynebacterium sp. TaxID=1720 RepID=UPI0019AC4644|nr:TIGR02611 family protein [Corynebacterium sp.]HHU68443.1 TIGR02611 family protein [Corynebacterium sp.]